MREREPLIGITTYARDEANRLYLPADYVDAVRRAGGIPFLIPPGAAPVNRVLGRVDGLVLAGGGDIDPARYGGRHHPTVYMVDAERDSMELAMVTWAVEHNLPMLAICRGAQVVNVALGGTLHVHLPDVVGEKVLHRAPPREPTPHEVAIDERSRLSAILGHKGGSAMSLHHQAIDKVAPPLRAVAWAADGLIEAVELPEHRWLVAVQWHPELSAATDPVQQRLFDALVNESSRVVRA